MPQNIVAICLTGFVAFGGILFGYDTGTINGILSMPFWKSHFGNHVDSTGSINITTSQKSEVVSLLSVGTFFGALAAAPFGDFLGRKYGLIASCLVFSVGVAMQVASTALPLFIGGRVIAGLGVGLVSCLIPMYQSECAPKKIRGAIVGLYQLAITIGIMLAAIVNNSMQSRNDPSGYRWVLAIQLFYAAILAFGMFFLPETPRYLIKKGKLEEAARSLGRLRTSGRHDPEVDAELKEIKANLDYELEVGHSSYIDCFKGMALRRTLLGVFIQMFQQLTGVNFIFYYGTIFFQQAGIELTFKNSMITTIVNVLSTFPGLYAVEKLGRRNLLLYGAVIMCVSQFIVGIVGVASDTPESKKALIAFTCIFIFGFAASWGPVAWVLTGELFALKTRAKQMSLATASNWFWNWCLAFVTPYITDPGFGNLGVKIAFLWGALNFTCFAYVFFLIPETRGLALEEVDELFESRISPLKSASFVPTIKYADRTPAEAKFAMAHGETDHPQEKSSENRGETVEAV